MERIVAIHREPLVNIGQSLSEYLMNEFGTLQFARDSVRILQTDYLCVHYRSDAAPDRAVFTWSEIDRIGFWSTWRFDCDGNYIIVVTRSGHAYAFYDWYLSGRDNTAIRQFFLNEFIFDTAINWPQPVIVYPSSAQFSPLYPIRWRFRLRYFTSLNQGNAFRV